jgi:GNAT superfamily N-acetyltransferase
VNSPPGTTDAVDTANAIDTAGTQHASGAWWLAEPDARIRARLCARLGATGTAVRAFATTDELLAAHAAQAAQHTAPAPTVILLRLPTQVEEMQRTLGTLRGQSTQVAAYAHGLDAAARAAALDAGAQHALETPMLGRFIAARMRAGSDAASTDTRARDGRWVTIRCMRPEDADHEQAFVRGLSAASRRTRFFSAIRELSPAMLHAFTHPDYPHSCALVATVSTSSGTAPTHADEAQVAVARYSCVNPFEATPAPRAAQTIDSGDDDARSEDAGEAHRGKDSASAEFAIVVADGWEGQGIAARLLRDLISAADIAGLARLEGLVLRDNRRMLRFAHALGFSSSVDPADHTVARVVHALRD